MFNGYEFSAFAEMFLYSGNCGRVAIPFLMICNTRSRSAPDKGKRGALTCSEPMPSCTSASLMFCTNCGLMSNSNSGKNHL